MDCVEMYCPFTGWQRSGCQDWGTEEYKFCDPGKVWFELQLFFQDYCRFSIKKINLV